MKYIKKIILPLILFISIVSSLWSTTLQEEKNVTITRFDKDVLSYLELPNSKNGEMLIQKYPVFLPAFVQTIEQNTKGSLLEDIQIYFSHPMLNKLYHDAVEKYNDIHPYEAELAKMLGIAEYELETQNTPRFFVHVSGYRQNVIYINNIISLSIDKYLGEHYAGYKGFFRGNQLYQMQPKMLVRDFTKAWLIADFIKKEQQSTSLLSKMIEEGKILYALSILLPNIDENDIIGVTKEELNSIKENEDKTWKSIIKKKQLYETDLQIVNSYFDGQDKKRASEKQPLKIGAWIGYQMIKQYSKNSKQNLSTLLETNPETILKLSRYNP